jgi:energy-coupling factor transporter ATP-binding protein EcfA2
VGTGSGTSGDDAGAAGTSRDGVGVSCETGQVGGGTPRLLGRGLTLAYERRTVAEGLTVAIPDRSFTVVVGPNACGKSTLLRVLARMLKPRSGTVLLDGKDIHARPTRAGRGGLRTAVPCDRRSGDRHAAGRSGRTAAIGVGWSTADKDSVEPRFTGPVPATPVVISSRRRISAKGDQMIKSLGGRSAVAAGAATAVIATAGTAVAGVATAGAAKGEVAVARVAVPRVATGGVAVAPANARADRFAMTYTCAVPLLGTRSVDIDGTLTAAPNRLPADTATRVGLHISRMSLRPPVAVDSWTATADIDVTGAESAAFRVTGAGGPVPAYQSVTGDLSGEWTPKAAGVDRLRIGRVVVRARTSAFGEATASCTPRKPRPVAEFLTVLAPDDGSAPG